MTFVTITSLTTRWCDPLNYACTAGRTIALRKDLLRANLRFVIISYATCLCLVRESARESLHCLRKSKKMDLDHRFKFVYIDPKTLSTFVTWIGIAAKNGLRRPKTIQNTADIKHLPQILSELAAIFWNALNCAELGWIGRTVHALNAIAQNNQSFKRLESVPWERWYRQIIYWDWQTHTDAYTHKERSAVRLTFQRFPNLPNDSGLP